MNWQRSIIAAAILLAIACPAFAVILHDDTQLPVGQRPDNAVVGRWMPNNASYGKATCVAIAPNYILTSRHQGWNANTTVSFDVGGITQTYKVAQTWTTGNVDLMVGRLTTMDGAPAYLENWANLYTGGTSGTNFAIGGYGQGRGTNLTRTGGDVYGYTWAGADNDTLRWGKNSIDGTSTQTYGVSWGTASSSSLNADFDGPGNYEASIALWDSGSPWMVQVGNEWQVAAVSTITTHALNEYAPGESWFRKQSNGQAYPDKFYGTSTQAYDDWIWSVIPQPAPMAGDANGDGTVTDADYTVWADNYMQTNATWHMGDWNNDRIVTDADYTIWADNYGAGVTSADYPGGPGGTLVPEPASMALLGLGLLVVLSRRR